MDVGKRIVELRERKNMSTNKLANLAGISQSYLRDLEMDKKNPTVAMLSYISLQDFFSEQRNKVNPYLLSAIQLLDDEEQFKLSEFICAMKKTN